MVGRRDNRFGNSSAFPDRSSPLCACLFDAADGDDLSAGPALSGICAALFCSTQFTQKVPTDLRLLRSNTLPHCAFVISIGTHCVPFGTLCLPRGRSYFSGSRVGLLETFSAFRSFGLILPRCRLPLRLGLLPFLRLRWDCNAQKWDKQSASEQRFCTQHVGFLLV